MPARRRATPRVIIIGAGMSGILMGIRLRQHGIASFKILEKAATLGGTWRDNIYPGLTCDVPSHLYVYSFAPNPNWTRRFPPREEIWQYFHDTARRFGVLPKIAFNKEVASARWEGSFWRVRTADGEVHDAEILITAISRLHHPAYPAIPGLDSFGGPVIHSARWDPKVDLRGKRVGLIGTGSTSAQILSATVDQVARITVFQRTPQWVLPVPNPPIGRWKKLLLRFKPYARSHHRELTRQFAVTANAIIAQTEKGRAPRRQPTLAALDLIRDPVLRAKLTPNYQPSCKRMVISDRYHDAIQRPNAVLVTDSIERVEPKGVVTADGTLHAIDVLVLATGFVTDKYLDPMDIVGRDGIRLVDQWRDLFITYKTVGVPGMPNFFMVNGPYGPLGSAIVPAASEVQADYVLKLVDRVATGHVALEPMEAKAVEWVKQVRELARHSVFGDGGCRSYYLDRFGVPTINPQTIEQMRDELAVPRLEDFIETPICGGSTG